MPGYGWSAPSSYPLGGTSATTLGSAMTLATPFDISPYPQLISAGSLNLGTRIRLFAMGTYTGTSTTTTLTWTFVLNAPGTAIGSGIVLTTGPTITMVSITGLSWEMVYWGHVAAVSTTGSTTAGSFVGRGQFSICTTASLTAAQAQFPMPQTLAAATVAQSTNAGNTANEQNIQLGITPATTLTGFTNVIVDELTCELVG